MTNTTSTTNSITFANKAELDAYIAKAIAAQQKPAPVQAQQRQYSNRYNNRQQQKDIILYDLPFEAKETVLLDTEFFAIGNQDIINAPIVGIACSNSASDRGLSLSRQLGTYLVQHSATLLIDGIKKEDIVAINAALKTGGNVIIMLSVGLKTLDLKPLAEEIEKGKVLILSRTMEDSYTNELGAKNNKDIVNACDALFIAEALGRYNANNDSWTGGVINLMRLAFKEELPVFMPSIIKEDRPSHLILKNMYDEINFLKTAKSQEEALLPLNNIISKRISEIMGIASEQKPEVDNSAAAK